MRLLEAALAAAIVVGIPAAAVAADGSGHVRPLQERGQRLLERGAERSATFRQLLEDVAATDVIVYLDLNPYEGLELDGVLRFVGTGPGVRYVSVWLRPRRIDDELIATLAHELRHAVEVGGAPNVTSQGSLARLYQTIGHSDNPGRFESDGAQEVALHVAAELRQSR